MSNVHLYKKISKPIVCIIVNHESINRAGAYLEFYSLLAQAFAQTMREFMDYDYVILNGLEIKDVGEGL